ncbi:hypothetical protein BX257_4780 [Streptomyces sp. 3212.3]|uniref:hypothetical protein n=1 Tax=Streptomyces sp. 3212.3 TaxID=1938846 RepID=UPI000E223439|nr:hypothetical protein [Streptomyces sp. 3212.3]REE62167.1 hypothetical protein BX257_4780 [Streptomyces sp. 3212.3]
MDQPIQPTASTAVTVRESDVEQRSSLMHAFSEAEQIVSQLHTLPTDVMVRGDLSTGAYGIRLFFSDNQHAVLEFATTFDAEVTSSPSLHGAGSYLTASTWLNGIDVQAWTVVDENPPEEAPTAPAPAADTDTLALPLATKAAEVLV